MACVEQCLFIIGLGSCNSFIELGIDVRRKIVVERVEVVGERFRKVECLELLAHVLQLGADFTDSFHIYLNFYAEFLTEHVYKFKCRSCTAFAKIPDVGVEDVDAVDNCHQSRCQAISWSTVGVEVNRNVDVSFQLWHERCNACRVNQSGHILEGDNLGTHLFEAFGFFNEVFVGEDFLLLGRLFPE